MTTGRSRARREVLIPVYDDLPAVLARIRRRSPLVLTSRQRPWKAGAFTTAFVRAKVKAGRHDRDLDFHCLRGAAAAKFYVAGLSIRVIAEILGWNEEQVEKIIRRYVARDAATRAAIQLLNAANSPDG